MKKIINRLKESPLFQEISDEDMERIVECFEIKPFAFEKDQFLVHQGDRAKGVGIVLEGTIYIIREDFLGNREILTEASAGDLFGEVYAVLSEDVQNVAVIGAGKGQAAFLSIDRLMTTCHNQCGFHQQMIKNLLRVLARKNQLLTGKLSHLSKRTLREKIVSYLSEERLRQGGSQLVIPFNRQQLADYLSVERSALSRELSNMQKDGLITFYKNQFSLVNMDEY